MNYDPKELERQAKYCMDLIEKIQHDSELVVEKIKYLIRAYQIDEEHDCKLDSSGTGHCDHPSHPGNKIL